MTYLARGFVTALVATLAASCYQPRAADCQLACVEGTLCPSGLTCRSDGYCHRVDDPTSCLDAAAVDAADAVPADALDASDGPGPDPDAGVTSTAIAAGNRHACAIRGGALYCWGDNRSDQAGAVATSTSNRRFPAPRRLGTDADWTAVAAGLRHTCGIRAGGQVFCWGDATASQIGAPTTTATPNPVSGPTGLPISTASAVCAGAAHSCAIVDGGADVLCWGNDDSGQRGDGGGPSLPSAQATTVTRPTTGVHWSGLACGAAHTCAIGDGDVYCWGASGSFRLGHNGPATDAPSTAVAVTGATAVAAGETFSCARLANGTARCWGSFGTTSGAPPSDLGMTGVTAVSAGFASLCATTGALTRCLGYGGRGDLGDGTFGVSSGLGAAVQQLNGVTALTSGTDFHCALAGGQVRCWGKNSDGQLGVGTTSTLFTPTVVPGQWRRVAAGRYATCAVSATDATVSCWGHNVGNWSVPAPAPALLETPTLVPDVGPAIDVAVGTDHACAITSDGTVRCWGDTLYGRVGVGATTSGVVPATAPQQGGAPLHATRIAVSDHGSIAADLSGLWVWGDDAGNRLGVDPPTTIATPRSVDASPMWSSPSLGADFGCGLRNQVPLCWGQGASGQLGTGAMTAQTTPQLITGYTFSALAAAAFGDHVCAVAADALTGQLYCWGDNSHRQGNALATNSPTPRRQGAMADWSAVAAGRDTSCGIRGGTAGSLECWGANDDDAFMAGLDRAPGDVTTPTSIGLGFASVTLGATHGCAVTAAPGFELRCWGDSRYGASGLAGHHDFATPQLVTFP